MGDDARDILQAIRDMIVKHDADFKNHAGNMERAVDRQTRCVEEMKNALIKLTGTMQTVAKKNGNGQLMPLIKWLVVAVILAALGSKGLELLVSSFTKGTG